MPIITVTNNVPPVTRVSALPEFTKKNLELRDIHTQASTLVKKGKLGELQVLLTTLHASPKLPKKAQPLLTKVTNQVTSLKETEAMFGQRTSARVLSKLEISLMETFAHISELDTKNTGEKFSRQEIAEQRFRESAAEIFRGQNSPEAAKLKAMLADKGLAVGKAPIVFVLTSSIDVAEVKMHFNAEMSGGYLMVKDLTVIGVTKEFCDSRSFKSMKDGIELMSSTWNAKNGHRFYIFDSHQPWAHALWALAIPTSDLNVLHKAAHGRFRPAKWGFGFNS